MPNNNAVILTYKDSDLIIHKVVADRLNLTAGQTIDEATFLKVIVEDASHTLALARAMQHPKN